jgi:asparagine synthase (glutamine-hydrolysing)
MADYVAQVHDLTDPASNAIENMSLDAARECVRRGNAADVRGIAGSFALAARDGQTVRMARSLDRPLRYFLAKREAGPSLIVSDRIDAIHAWLKAEGLADQFHPSYTRMVPAHYVTTLQVIGCPDPSPSYERFLTPRPDSLPANVEAVGGAYIGALANEIARWLDRIPKHEPIGVCFSGGIDSGAVFLVTYHLLRSRGDNLGRLKAFTLGGADAPDASQARHFLEALDLGLFLEPFDAELAALDADETIRVLEDYKELDVQCGAVSLALCRGIRRRYPEWRHLVDGDGGDENLKDYPIEENPELTIRSVVHNPLLYQEGWGVGTMKHSLTYSGGLSRSCVRTYAPARHYGFEGFSPFTRPAVVELAAGIPFIALTGYDVPRLYALKGEIVAHGVRAVTGIEMPVFPKRRFQHGALGEATMARQLPWREREYRRRFLARYA